MMLFKVLTKSGVIITLLTFSFFHGSGQTQPEALDEIQAHREKQQKEFKDKAKSPLTAKDFKKFKGLNYYPVDLKYRVAAKFVKSGNPVFFKMKTTTDRLPDYSKYGEVTFVIDSQEYKLEVYQSPDVMKMPG